MSLEVSRASAAGKRQAQLNICMNKVFFCCVLTGNGQNDWICVLESGTCYSM